MKDGLEQLPGKTIRAVVADRKWGRVFLIFSDEIHFEFYPDTTGVNWTRAVDAGGLERVLGYVNASEAPESVAIFE